MNWSRHVNMIIFCKGNLYASNFYNDDVNWILVDHNNGLCHVKMRKEFYSLHHLTKNNHWALIKIQASEVKFRGVFLLFFLFSFYLFFL